METLSLSGTDGIMSVLCFKASMFSLHVIGDGNTRWLGEYVRSLHFLCTMSISTKLPPYLLPNYHHGLRSWLFSTANTKAHYWKRKWDIYIDLPTTLRKSYNLKSRFILILSSLLLLGLSDGRFSPKILYVSLVSHILAACSNHRSPLDFIIVTMLSFPCGHFYLSTTPWRRIGE